MNSSGVAAIAVAVLASAARAQSPLCTEFRSTDVPLAVTYEVRMTAPGKGEVAPSRQEQRQVFRKDRETVVYTVQTPAIFLRTRGTNPPLPTEYLYSSHPPARTRTYSIDTSVDLGGCTFVVKLIQTLDGTAERTPISTSDEIWVSPELRVPLYGRFSATGVEVTSVAVAISKDFKHAE